MSVLESPKNKAFLLVGVSMLCLAAYSGYEMQQLNAVQKLWGHLPLGLFIGAWFGYIALRFFFKSTENQRNRTFFAVLSGILLSSGFVPFPFLPGLFSGLAVLLWLEKEITEEDAPKTGKTFYRVAWTALFTWNILTTYWVSNAALLPGVFAMVANASLQSIPLWAFHKVHKRVGDFWGYLSFISFWLSFEYFHQQWELSWAWLTLGNSFAHFPALVQWYEFTGVFGGSLWILLTNLVVFYIFKNRKIPFYESSMKKAIVGLVALIVIPVVSSFILFFSYTSNIDKRGAEEGLEVVVIQPNFEPHYEKFEISEATQMITFKELAAEGCSPKTKYLLFPETSFDIGYNNVNQEDIVIFWRNFLKQFPQTNLVTGVGSFYILPPGSTPTPYARYQKRQNFWYESHNAAIQLDTTVGEVPYYIKSKLVPGSESFPYKKYLKFMRPIVDKLGGSLEGLGVQEEREVFTSMDGSCKVAPVICYESIYGGYVTGYIQKGANLIFISTNDGWWDDTPGHRQHSAFASLRAIENRRQIARSANTGISCFIDEAGRISNAQPYNTRAFIKKNMMPMTQITFYVRFGDYIAWIAILISFSSLLFFLKKLFKV